MNTESPSIHFFNGTSVLFACVYPMPAEDKRGCCVSRTGITVVSHHVGPGNETQDLRKSSKSFNH